MNNNIIETNSIINNETIDLVKIQKMAFIYNAIDNGWTVKKKNNLYIFSKNHENKKEVYLDKYLRGFIVQNFNIDSIIS
jgi:hypothetical protein